MALTFRYRYVDFGTVFTGDVRTRDLGNGSNRPSTLFANELAIDVGGTCWGSNEPLPVIDHHYSRAGQFPSASAAVLHKARLIRDRFAGQDVVWLVTHKQPDFDAFCSMYLARWILESGTVEIEYDGHSLHPDAWLEAAASSRFDWFNPDLSRIAPEHHWAVLLASFASHLDERRPVACPRQRTLNSVLQAAIRRGRDYLSETSGAIEFFDEVKSCLSKEQLDPLYDSVLESSAFFAPELAMLDTAAEAYGRDIQRARRSIIYLPQSEAPSPKFFKTPLEVAALQIHGKLQEVNAERLLLADTFRIPTSAVYLRDPECSFFQDWARLDLENSPLGAGFEFTALAFPNGRANATINQTDYVFAVDPERANGRHLYTVWSRLQTSEVEALHMQHQRAAAPDAIATSGPEQRTGPLETLLANSWIGGQNTTGVLVETPQRGTAMAVPGMRSDLRDDPIVEEVRTELENSVYVAESLVAGPQVTIVDLAGASELKHQPPRNFDLNHPLKITAPPNDYFRFAVVRLRADSPIAPAVTSAEHGSRDGSAVVGEYLARQIGETLWQVLYPAIPGSTPPDFYEHLVLHPDSVGVWSERGIAIAQKSAFNVGAAPHSRIAKTALFEDFGNIVRFLRDVARFTADAQLSNNLNSGGAGRMRPQNEFKNSIKSIVGRGDELNRRAAQIERSLALPDAELLRRFCQNLGFGQLLATLHDLSRSAAEGLRREEAAEQESRAVTMRENRRRLLWLKVFGAVLLVVAIVDGIAANLKSSAALPLSLLAAPVSFGVMLLALKPWKLKGDVAQNAREIPPWLLACVAVACIASWLLGLLYFLSK